jgi:excisionase family DNA binding protein
MPPTPYLTVTEAAAYIRQEPATLERWCKEGEVAYIRTPTGKLFTADHLDRLMLSRLYPARKA